MQNFLERNNEKAFVLIAALVWGCSAVPLMGQVDDPASSDLSVELDEFRMGLFTKFNEGKYEEMLDEYCDENIIAMWQDGSICKGHAGALAEFEKLSKIIDRIQVDPVVEERLVLNDGAMVISSGQMRDTYALKRGETVALNSVWTATMVKHMLSKSYWPVAQNAPSSREATTT